ncbi:MAG: hypothetical protein ACFWT6_10725 [Virgibacillus proomii]|jgi:hypothetical protein
MRYEVVSATRVLGSEALSLAKFFIYDGDETTYLVTLYQFCCKKTDTLPQLIIIHILQV